MSDRDILDQIDDVITWHGSDDAMRWTAEPPKQPALPIPDEEAMRRFGERLAGQVQAFLDAFRPAAEQMMRSVGEALRAFAAVAPHMQQVEEARRAERRAMRQAYDRRRRARGRRR